MSEDFGLMAFLFASIMGLVGLVIGIILYVVHAYALMVLAKRRGIENPWLAFIPVANYYILGKLVGEIRLFSFVIPQAELVLPAGIIASFALVWLPLVGQLLPFAFMAIHLGALYRLYQMYKPGSEVLYTILSGLLAFTIGKIVDDPLESR